MRFIIIPISLTLLACEASQPQTPIEQPELAPPEPVATLQEPEAPAPVTPAEPPAPAKILEHRLSKRAGPGGAAGLLAKRCTEVDGACDLSTVSLTLDGKALSYRPPAADPEQPFGEFGALSVFRHKGALTMELHRQDTIEHIQLAVDNGEISTVSQQHWPRNIEKILLKDTDWDGDGQKHDLILRCRAVATNVEPVDCEGVSIKQGDAQIYQAPHAIIGGDIEAAVLTSKKGQALRLTMHLLEGEWAPTSVRVFAATESAIVPVWEVERDGQFTWKKDGSWTLQESECQRPAELDWDEKNEKEIVRKFGRAKITTTAFRWNGNTVATKVTSRKMDRKSSCQTEGRCPFVYAGTEDRYLGEILRDQVGPEDKQNEFIVVPRDLVEGGSLSIRIAELKPDEITYIDSAWLVVAGHRITATEGPTAMLSTDQSSLQLATNDDVKLRFDNIPSTGTILLFANGYYINLRP